MDALMAALVAAALIQIGDRPAWLVAILADRYRAAGTVVAMAALAIAGASVLAVVGGVVIAPYLTPEAKAVFLALALLLQGGGALLPAKMPERLEGWRLGTAMTSLSGLFILAFGDGLQFVVLALAARSTLPWLAAIGATVGSIAVLAPAAILGERDWRRLPLNLLRRGIALLFVLAGIVLGLSGVGLI